MSVVDYVVVRFLFVDFDVVVFCWVWFIVWMVGVVIRYVWFWVIFGVVCVWFGGFFIWLDGMVVFINLLCGRDINWLYINVLFYFFGSDDEYECGYCGRCVVFCEVGCLGFVGWVGFGFFWGCVFYVLYRFGWFFSWWWLEVGWYKGILGRSFCCWWYDGSLYLCCIGVGCCIGWYFGFGLFRLIGIFRGWRWGWSGFLGWSKFCGVGDWSE